MIRADLILIPYRTTKPGIILELKVDSNPIDVIKKKLFIILYI